MSKCGVDESLFTEYHFEDHEWFVNNFSDLWELQQRCVLNGGSYYMKSADTKVWDIFKTQTGAVRNATNIWNRNPLSSKNAIDQELINMFFTGEAKAPKQFDPETGKAIKSAPLQVGSCHTISGGTMSIPYGFNFIKYKDRTFLNTCNAEVKEGDKSHLKQGLAMLRLIYRSLCNGPELDADPTKEGELLLGLIQRNDSEEIRCREWQFVMNWLAAIVQEPGINLQTNLFFTGAPGVGKGTLLEVMRRILGKNLVGKLNQSEIVRGWYDHIMDKVLIEVDEFNTAYDNFDWYGWLKSYTTNNEISISKRNNTSYEVINIGNYIFTSNIVGPIKIDDNDRRFQFVNTTMDTRWEKYARGLFDVKIGIDNVADGLAWIFNGIKIDRVLISSSFFNTAKQNVKNYFDNPVEDWLSNDVSVKRDEWIQSGDLFDRFKLWGVINLCKKDQDMSLNRWGREMSKMTTPNKPMKKTDRVGTFYMLPAVAVQLAVQEPNVYLNDLNSMMTEEIKIANFDQPIEKEVCSRSALGKLREALAKQD